MTAEETSSAARASTWLRRRYREMVELSGPAPVAEGHQLWVFGCRAVPVAGYPETPMLTSLVAVPKNGAEPFHPATDDPWKDMAAFDRDPRPRDFAAQAWRTNARGCVIAMDAEFSDGQASALPWQPHHEAPGWWDRMIHRYFTGAEISACADWDEVIQAIREPGRGTRGVVWIRRELGGVEATGHLIHVHHHNSGEVMLVDAQARCSANLGPAGVRRLTLARIAPPPEPTCDIVPSTAEDAVAAVKAAGYGWALPDGSPGSFTAEEFDLGFAVYADKPFDPNRPIQYGGSCYVVDKENGRVSTMPLLPVEYVAERYAKWR